MDRKQKILFSIIIPTLNEEHFIPLLLKDLKHQYTKNFEVIIVDGSSVDKTGEEALKYAKYFPLQIFTVKKRNVSYQRNYGAQIARGKYIIFLDADSRIYPSFTKRLTSAVKEKRGLLYLPVLIPDDPTQRNKMLFKFVNSTIEISHTLGKPLSPASAIFIEKNLFKLLGGFDEDMFLSEDHALIQKAYDTEVKAHILKDIKVVFSMRRVKKEGEMSVLTKYLTTLLYMMVRGDVRRKIFTYKMGGQEYTMPTRSIRKKYNFPQILREYLN